VFIDRALVVVESVIFADALVDATMQDGGKRERSNDAIVFSVIVIKCNIFKNLSHTTKIKS